MCKVATLPMQSREGKKSEIFVRFAKICSHTQTKKQKDKQTKHQRRDRRFGPTGTKRRLESSSSSSPLQESVPLKRTNRTTIISSNVSGKKTTDNNKTKAKKTSYRVVEKRIIFISLCLTSIYISLSAGIGRNTVQQSFLKERQKLENFVIPNRYCKWSSNFESKEPKKKTKEGENFATSRESQGKNKRR